MSQFNSVVLMAVAALEPEAYTVAIHRHITAHLDKEPSYGYLHGALKVLEMAGLVRSETRPGTEERGGRSRMLYWLTDEGAKVKKKLLEEKSSINRPQIAVSD